MKSHLPSRTRQIAPSRQATMSVDSKTPKAVPHHTVLPAEHASLHSGGDPQKSVSRRLHRKQAATYLGTSLSWLDKSRLRGNGPAYLQVGGRVIYDVQDLDAYLATCRRQSTSEPR